MFFVRKYCRFLALPMAALMFAVSMPLGAAQAALVSTDQVVETSEIEADRMRIAALMTREDVQRQLKAQGVDPDEANGLGLPIDEHSHGVPIDDALHDGPVVSGFVAHVAGGQKHAGSDRKARQNQATSCSRGHHGWPR